MKKYIYLIICLAVFTLVGCNKKDQMVDFIPTSTPSGEENDEVPNDTSEDTDDTNSEEDSEDAEENSEEDTADKPIIVGNTTTKYVKLNEYGDYLNVRSAPSMEGEIVGSLVHTEKIEVIDIEDGWARFVLDNKYRYVSAKYLVDERPEYLNPPTKAPTLSPTPTPNPEVTTPPEI